MLLLELAVGLRVAVCMDNERSKLPITTVSLFHLDRWADAAWGFLQMGRGPTLFQSVPGLQFVKLLGSGGGDGFNRMPNFRVYAFLGCWDEEAAANHFFESNPHFRAWQGHCQQLLTVYLRPMMAHGQWDGQQPFTITEAPRVEGPVAVLTRATIYPQQVPRFWKYVAPVSRAIQQHPEHLLSIGIGELPWFVQATFSLWTDAAAMRRYAYQQAEHREVVRKTRELGWYKEELFARFLPYRLEGGWPAVDMQQLANQLELNQS